MRDDLERPTLDGATVRPGPKWEAARVLAGVESGAVALPYDPNAVGSLVRRLFIETLDAQEAKGLAEYGQPLAAHNGRDAFADLLAEMIDAWQYAVQARMERDALEAALAEALAERDQANAFIAECSVCDGCGQNIGVYGWMRPFHSSVGPRALCSECMRKYIATCIAGEIDALEPHP